MNLKPPRLTRTREQDDIANLTATVLELRHEIGHKDQVIHDLHGAQAGFRYEIETLKDQLRAAVEARRMPGGAWGQDGSRQE